MQRIRSTFPRQDRDSGLTLIELIVAVAVLALITAGVSSTVVTVLSSTTDSKARVAAANLASAEIDLARSYKDVFAVISRADVVPVSGIDYRIDRDVAWVSNTGADVTCNASGGALQYKRVNVTVSWKSQSGEDKSARADTIITPGSRINDPLTGTIQISVKTASGSGNDDVVVSAVPVSGGAAITTVIPRTDADGCSYILKVKPGGYRVKIVKTGNVDADDNASPTRDVAVVAGTSAAAAFGFDRPATYTPVYVPTPTPTVSIGTPKLPSNFELSFLSTYKPVVRTGAAAPVKLFPWTTGYHGVPGRYAGATTSGECTVGDPGAWAPDETSSPPRVGARLASATAAPGESTDLSVPIGVVRVAGGLSGTYLFAVQEIAPRLPGEPKCSTSVTYNYGAIASTGSGTATIYLPFGTWKIYSATSATASKSLVPATKVTVLSGGQTENGSNTVTLDPRQVSS